MAVYYEVTTLDSRHARTTFTQLQLRHSSARVTPHRPYYSVLTVRAMASRPVSVLIAADPGKRARVSGAHYKT